MEKYKIIFDAIEESKEKILAAERYIWTNPELGFREWKTHAYLKGEFERLGYTVTEAGDIPGFYTDIDTGREGPRVAVFAEMDALFIPDHPECDKETGVVHACGHHFQCAALLGIATALKKEGALDNLSGSIRLIAVPCEEMSDMAYIKSLIEKGTLHFYGGKQEFLYRGYLDGVDMAIMVHGRGKGFAINQGCNGSISKHFTFIGKSAHAAGAVGSNNALYAANTAMAAANALRESMSGINLERYSAIITNGGEAVNVIPAVVKVAAQVRGLTMNSILSLNEKINRAYAAGALSQGCRLIIDDSLGYSPRKEDKNLQNAFLSIAKLLFDEDEISVLKNHAAGCTDMGDISMVMPVCHAFVGGGEGNGHTKDYRVRDAYLGCVTNAKLQTGVLVHLLENDAELAKKVISEKQVEYPSIEAYLDGANAISFKGEAITYCEDGRIEIKIKK